MKIRFIRLWPLFFLGSLLGLVVAFDRYFVQAPVGWSIPQLLMTFVLSLLMLPSPFSPTYDVGALYPINSPSWSLLQEMIVNFLYALLRRRMTLLILFVVIGLSAIALVADAFTYNGLDSGFGWNDAYTGVPRVIYSFSVGFLIFKARQKYTRNFHIHSSIASLGVLGMVVIVLGAPTCFSLSNPVYVSGIVLFVLPVLVLLGSFVEPGKFVVHGFAGLGLASYGIYVLQSPIVSIVGKGFSHITKTEVSTYAPYAGFALAVGLFSFALILDRYYDQPLRKLLKKVI